MRNSGFTIVELLIAVTIGGLLLTGVLAAFRGLGTKQAVKQAGISFAADLKSYQQKALAGIKPSECGAALEGYQVNYGDSNSYSVTAVCVLGEPAVTEVNLPAEVSFQAAFSPSQIFFPVLQPAITGAQTIVLEKDTYQYQVIVEASGVIRGEML